MFYIFNKLIKNMIKKKKLNIAKVLIFNKYINISIIDIYFDTLIFHAVKMGKCNVQPVISIVIINDSLIRFFNLEYFLEIEKINLTNIALWAKQILPIVDSASVIYNYF